MSKDKPHFIPYLWPAGLGGLVATERIIVAARWESAPIRRAVRKAKALGLLIDLTYGRACKWVLFLDSGHLVLSAVAMPVAVIDDGEFDAFLIHKHGEV